MEKGGLDFGATSSLAVHAQLSGALGPVIRLDYGCLNGFWKFRCNLGSPPDPGFPHGACV